MVRGMAQSDGLEPAGELERSEDVCASTRFIDKCRSALALVAAAATLPSITGMFLKGAFLSCPCLVVQLGRS